MDGRTSTPEEPLTTDGADVLVRRAEELDRQGRYDQAGAALDAAIVAARNEHGRQETLVRALTSRSSLFRYEGRLELALDAIREATQVVAATQTVDPVARCELEVESGHLRLETSEPDAAERHLQAAADIARQMEEGPDREIALTRSMAALGTSSRLRGDFAEGEALLLEAVERATSAVARGPDDGAASMELVHILDELGILYKFSGAFDASEETYARAQALLTQIAGPDHPDFATIQHNLGGLAHARGDAAAGEPFARRSVELHARSLGHDHLATVLDRSALAAILDRLDRVEEAEALLLDCAERLERVLGPHHRELGVVLNNLAAIAQRQGRLDDAERLYLRAVAIKERALGPGAPSLAITLNNLATVHRRQGRHRDAAALYERTLTILVSSVGPDHPDVAVVRRNLARLDASAGGEMSPG